MSTIRLAGIIKQSITDGPGLRFTIFTQGCPHHCVGCHNPETWDYSDGQDYQTNDILALFDKNPLLKGITFSGGEPLVQAGSLISLAKEIKHRGKDIVCYTGYTFEEILTQSDKSVLELLEHVDILIDGPYIKDLRDLSALFRGSSNQRMLDMKASLRANSPINF